ncbi:polysaccharide deacetylase family protein [Nostocoides sp. F2B08]|uniref:polysaccharide deacetylase family protein n=1 Tax=Nostocoides sp. F2B08 TaxID=2653936 RepID=UPI001D05B7FD|nr:polysaccharide deacetylase family protein [Tetrasphaera sp. F2B08]
MDVERVATTKRVVALTFDGGASDAGGRKILDTLAAKNAPATFFFTGDFTLDHPALAREIARSYPVGNHTQTHPDLTTLTRTQVVDQIRSGRATIRAQTGAETRPLFRFPFGARDATTIGLVNDECYVAYRWTVDTLGWKGTSGGITAEIVYERVMAGLQPGEIVLMHVGSNPKDGTTLDADALPRIIDGIRAAGYTLVTLPR